MKFQIAYLIERLNILSTIVLDQSIGLTGSKTEKKSRIKVILSSVTADGAYSSRMIDELRFRLTFGRLHFRFYALKKSYKRWPFVLCGRAPRFPSSLINRYRLDTLNIPMWVNNKRPISQIFRAYR